MKGKVLLFFIIILPVFLFSEIPGVNCLDFDGRNGDYAHTDEILDIGATYTIECWIFARSIDPIESAYGRTIVASSPFEVGAPKPIWIAINNGKVRAWCFALNSTSTYLVETVDAVIPTNQWTHVAVSATRGTSNDNGTPDNPEDDIVDEYGNVNIYVNGQPKATIGNGAGITPYVRTFTVGDLRPGNPDASPDPRGLVFDGYIDEVRVWDNIRNEDQIAGNRSIELDCSQESNLVAYWKFNDGFDNQFATDECGSTRSNLRLGDDTKFETNDDYSDTNLYPQPPTFFDDPYDPQWVISDDPLPVVLSTFTVIFADTSPLLLWTTMSETSNLGWNVYRSDTPDISNAFVINSGLIEGAGTTSTPTDYSFYDEYPAMSGITYWYWLETVDYSGETNLHGHVSLTVPAAGENHGTPVIPETFGLYKNYPNPFNPNTDISFALPEATTGELVIYNMKGQKIRTLFTGVIEAETLYNFTWDGSDEGGLAVTSGIYMYQLKTADKYSKMQKMVILK